MGITTIGSGFHSVNYVVSDAKRAAERFSSLVPGTAFAAGTVRMNPIDRGGLAVELDAAIAHLGPRGEYEVRMLHPLGRDPMFHRALAARGPGLHHVGFRVADLHCAAQRMARCAALAAELRDEAGGRHLFYTCDPIGGLIELSESGADSAFDAAAADSLAPYFTQIAYVVNDIAAARRWIEQALGCEVAAARDIVQGPAWNLHFRGQPVPYDFGLKMVIGKLGPAGEGQIELLEPQRNENVLAEFLNTHGPGLNHIAFAVPDYYRLTRALRSTGVPPLKEIHVPGTVHSSYFDCTGEELSTIEVFETGANA